MGLGSYPASGGTKWLGIAWGGTALQANMAMHDCRSDDHVRGAFLRPPYGRRRSVSQSREKRTIDIDLVSINKNHPWSTFLIVGDVGMCWKTCLKVWKSRPAAKPLRAVGQMVETDRGIGAMLTALKFEQKGKIINTQYARSSRLRR